MYKILGVIGVVAVLLNPLTGVQAQALVVAGWDWLILTVGWAVLVVFCVALVFVMGVSYAQAQAKDKQKLAKVTAKAKKSKKSKREGLEYEVTA